MDRRMALIEQRLTDVAPRQWVELFVKEIVQPIKDSIKSIEHAMSELSGDGQELYAAFKESIRKDEERKEKADKDKTLSATLLRWGALSGAIGGIWLIFRIGGTVLEGWLKSRGF